MEEQIQKIINKLGLSGVQYRTLNNEYVVFSNGLITTMAGRIIQATKNRGGYREVHIAGKWRAEHRIIAMSFIPNPDNLPCVNHKDGNKLNNNVENLEWCTYSENTLHAYRTGLEQKVIGENHHGSKLTDEAVRFCRANYKRGDKQFGVTALAKKYGVDKSTMCNAIKGNTWSETK